MMVQNKNISGDITKLLYMVCQFIHFLNYQNMNQGQETSLEEHLTDSIRRAKQKIFNNAIQNIHHTPEFLFDQLEYKNNSNAESRHRANSVRYPQTQSHNNKEQKSALAGAMKTLQSRINQLQHEKKQLLNRQKRQNHSSQEINTKKEQISQEISRLTSLLKDKQYEIKKLNRINSDLNIKNADLIQKIEELQVSLARINNNRHIKPTQIPTTMEKVDNQSMEKRYKSELSIQKNRVADLQQKIKELQTRNSINHQTIQQLIKKIQEEKQINMKWIKMHQSHLVQEEQKENNIKIINQEYPSIKIKQKQKRTFSIDQKRQLLDLKKNNKILYEKLNNNKHRMAELSRQNKQFEEKYNRIRLIATQISEEVNKLIPNHNSHVKFLISKMNKLDNNHSESLRIYSNHMRKSRDQQKSSDSKDRKRSLKMSDLNSSPKKSNERSHSKSHKKIKVINEEPLSKSEKKQDKKNIYEEEMDVLQKQVICLKKKYRNLIARKDKNNSQDFKLIQQVAQQYNSKKQQLDSMKKKLIF